MLWLLLVVIELFCPALCDDQAFAAEFSLPVAEVRISNNNENDSGKATVKTSESQNQNHQQESCGSDCLCHGTGILSLPFTFQKAVLARRTRILFLTGDPIFSSLPPPFRPPKNS